MLSVTSLCHNDVNTIGKYLCACVVILFDFQRSAIQCPADGGLNSLAIFASIDSFCEQRVAIGWPVAPQAILIWNVYGVQPSVIVLNAVRWSGDRSRTRALSVAGSVFRNSCSLPSLAR